MLEFALGVAYGILSFATFCYMILLGCAWYLEFGPRQYRAEDSGDTVVRFLGEVGPMRVFLYVALALLWPLPFVLLLLMRGCFKRYGSHDDMPKKISRPIDWVLLGFGKLIK